MFGLATLALCMQCVAVTGPIGAVTVNKAQRGSEGRKTAPRNFAVTFYDDARIAAAVRARLGSGPTGRGRVGEQAATRHEAMVVTATLRAIKARNVAMAKLEKLGGYMPATRKQKNAA